jgi:hypothetical protein
MRARICLVLVVLALGAGSVLPLAAPAGRAWAKQERAMVPAAACGEAWLEWRAERFAALSGELRAIQAEGGDQSAALAVPLRAWAAALRESEPPAALAGVMLMDAWQADEAAAAWELYAIGGSMGFDRDKETRFYDYRAWVFAAYAAICPTRHAFDSWTFSDGTVAPATPVAERVAPAARAEVCDAGWRTGARAEVDEVARVMAERHGLLTGQSTEAADRQRASQPPVAGVAVTVLLTYLYDELAAYWAQAQIWMDPGEPAPEILWSDAAPFFPDAALLLAAYDTVCGTAP